MTEFSKKIAVRCEGWADRGRPTRSAARPHRI